MSTWHQRKAGPVKLHHPVMWSVVDDPPQCMTSVMLFPSRGEADAYVQRRIDLGTGARHLFVLEPQQ